MAHARGERAKKTPCYKTKMATPVQRLSDSDLLAALEDLAMQHRELVATLAEHLAEVERRALHLALGYSSLYIYARERLGLSEHEAYLRIHAARASRRHPAVLEGLRSGALTLTAVKLVAPHLEAHPELLDQARGKSKRQVERAVAEITEASSVRTELRVRPLAGGKVELTVVVDEATAALFEDALDVTMHENPQRDGGRALAKALQLLIAAKQKPRGAVPAASERAVLGPRRCAFVGTDGHVCGETRFVELDHIVPRAEGGTDDPANLRWLCRSHNGYEAQRVLGPDRVLRAQRQREVASALQRLGFARAEATRASCKAIRGASDLALEPILRQALQLVHPVSGFEADGRRGAGTAPGP